MPAYVEYVTYNNRDFSQRIFCDSLDIAYSLKEDLEKLRHVSHVAVKETKEHKETL